MTLFNAHSTPFLLPETPKSGIALYVHWPWCLKKCPYCDFNAHVNPSRDESAYFSCILSELEGISKKVGKRSLTSIFFGGGTPSLASPHFIGAVIDAAHCLFPPSPDLLTNFPSPEVTLEVNPATYRPQMFHDFVSAGVTRFSIGVQSLDAQALNFLGRVHDTKEALNTINFALESGAEVSTDFIYGLPKQNLEIWRKNLLQMTQMGTHHLSAYQLTIEPHTKFFADVNKEKWQPLDDDHQADFYLTTHETLKESGFYGYEISNFAKTDVNNRLLACRHNLHVWRYGDYIGLGAGAHGRTHFTDNSEVPEKPNRDDHLLPSKTQSEDFASQSLPAPIPIHEKVATRNFKMPETYMREIKDKNQAYYEEILLTSFEAAQEAILNGLRLSEGLCVLKSQKTALKRLSECHFNWKNVLHLVSAHLLTLSEYDNFFILATTPRGQILLDSILESICQDIPKEAPLTEESSSPSQQKTRLNILHAI